MAAVLSLHFERLVAMASDGRWLDVMGELKEVRGVTQVEASQLVIRLAFYGNTVWVTPLVELGADLSYCDDVGDTALQACLDGSNHRKPTVYTAAALLKAGADPNGLARGGDRLLQQSIIENRPEFATLLLLHGADPHLNSSDYWPHNSFDVAKKVAAERPWALPMLERWQLERS